MPFGKIKVRDSFPPLQLTDRQKDAVRGLLNCLKGEKLEDFRVEIENGAFRMGHQFKIRAKGEFVDVTLGPYDCDRLAKYIASQQGAVGFSYPPADPAQAAPAVESTKGEDAPDAEATKGKKRATVAESTKGKDAVDLVVSQINSAAE